MQVDFDKFKRQVNDIINSKLHEKDAAKNTQALKKDIRTQIAALQNINEQINIVTDQMVIDIENLLEKINNLLATEELKSKTQALGQVLQAVEQETDRVEILVEKIKEIQRERSQLERTLKLKMECVKTPSQRDKMFKILLKSLELQEHLASTRFF